MVKQTKADFKESTSFFHQISSVGKNRKKTNQVKITEEEEEEVEEKKEEKKKYEPAFRNITLQSLAESLRNKISIEYDINLESFKKFEENQMRDLQHIQVTKFKSSSRRWTVSTEESSFKKLHIFEILILNYLVCLQAVGRLNEFRKLGEQLKSVKSENLLLVANVKMFELLHFYEEHPHQYQNIINRCKEVAIAFR